MAKQPAKKISYEDVADYFIALANDTGDTMTNLKLQKLVYYAQAWHLAIKKKPFFDADFEAWVHGPVIRDLYFQYKVHGSQPIVSELTVDQVKERFDSETINLLEEVANVYMPHNAYALELMTHQETPWIEARRGCEADDLCTKIIPKEAMAIFYGERIKDSGK